MRSRGGARHRVDRWQKRLLLASGLALLTGCQTTADNTRSVRGIGMRPALELEANWQAISPIDSKVFVQYRERPRQHNWRTDRDAIYMEDIGFSGGSMRYERLTRPIQAMPRRNAADQLLARWRNHEDLRKAGLKLDETRLERVSSEKGDIYIAPVIGEGSNQAAGRARSCAVFFRYGGITRLAADGAPEGLFEAVTGTICNPAGVEAARREALQLAQGVAFDNGRGNQNNLFAELLGDKGALLQNENLLAATTAAPEPARPLATGRPPGLGYYYGGVDFGRYHALVIGVQSYQHLRFPQLYTPFKDAGEVARQLRDDYGFAVTLLQDADKNQIVAALNEYRAKLGPGDNLLVYYAGHGLQHDDGQGYWIPFANSRDPINWISNQALNRAIGQIGAGRVIVVSDACFSGTLKEAEIGGLDAALPLRQAAARRARVVLASGGIEEVDDADNDNAEHSPFAIRLLTLLRHNHGLISGRALSLLVQQQVKSRGPDSQTPEYGALLSAGHENGADFFFLRRLPGQPGNAAAGHGS